MLQGRPLYDNDADAGYFVVPATWDPLIRAIERGLNVALVGDRGVGKTSLLYQVERTLRGSGEHVAFVDANAVAGAEDLAERLRDRLVGRPGASMQLDLTGFAGDPSPPPAGASRRFLQTLESLGDAEPTTVLVDASASAEAVFDIFGRMRDTLWQLPHHWVVALNSDDAGTALKPPADAFFDTVLHLTPFSTNDLAGLLARRAEVDSATLARVAGLAAGNPRTAIRALAGAEVTGEDPGEPLAWRGKLIESAADLGRPHAMLMAELVDRGSASPSDEELQRTLGVTRARLTALLRKLLAEGLVDAVPEMTSAPGRPRMVYRASSPPNAGAGKDAA